MQEVCIADAEALSRLLPAEPCLAEGCNCQSDGDCPGENGRYAICDFNQIEIMGTCFLTTQLSLSIYFYYFTMF